MIGTEVFLPTMWNIALPLAKAFQALVQLPSNWAGDSNFEMDALHVMGKQFAQAHGPRARSGADRGPRTAPAPERR